jgi:hypothetical protein
VHVVEALGGAAEGSYEQEAAVVEVDEEMEQEYERGVAKRPDLNKLDAHRPLEMETASRRQSAATRAWGLIGSAGLPAGRTQALCESKENQPLNAEP